MEEIKIQKKMQNSRSDQQLDLFQVVSGSTPAGYTYMHSQ